MGPKQGASRVEAAAALGMSRQCLYEHERKGRVVLLPDRSVDVEASRIRIATMKDNRGGRHDHSNDPPEGAPAPAPASDDGIDPIIDDATHLSPMMVEIRRKLAVMRKAEADARAATVEADEIEELVIKADDARKTCRAFGLRVRQAFESAVETRHQSLHAESGMDLPAARSWLSDFVRDVLAEVADAEPVE